MTVKLSDRGGVQEMLGYTDVNYTMRRLSGAFERSGCVCERVNRQWEV